ncbi:MAG TPA: two-component regulator propeller domain-containing protein, partial [Anaerolineae bacterium]|nr:two-component regulator propeller domain-containing protein [Anaerolineae bacterium]
GTRQGKFDCSPLVLAVMLTLAVIPLAPTPARAEPLFFHLTTADGLSHNIVYTILQDRQGFLWFGTQDGLNRYDGYTFTVFRHRRSDPASLVNNTVNVLYEDRAGTLWVGTVGGLDSFSGVGERFHHHTALPPESIGALYEDADGILWVGTLGSGLFRYDPATGQARQYRHDPADPTSLSDNDVLSLYADRAGTLWVGTLHGGLNAFDRAGGHFTRYTHDAANPHSLSDGEVTVIYEDHAGDLWVGTGIAHEDAVGGLDRLEQADGRFIHYRYNPQDPQSLSHNHVQALYEDRSGALWIGTEEGLNLFDRAGGHFLRVVHDPLDGYSLGHNDITAIYEDRSGNLWFGTKGGGIDRYARAKERFRRYGHDSRDPNSLGASAVGAIAQDPAGILWLGLYGGGLDRLDRATGHITHYRHDPHDPHSLGHDHVTALSIDHQGVLWIGTSAGLDRFDAPTGRFVHYVHDPTDPHTLGAGSVKVILEDHAHDLWIGTEEPGTLSRLERASGAFVRYDAVSTFGVRAIIEDHHGDLWLGTYNGLVHFDRRRGTFIQYRHDDADPHSLSNDFVWAVAEDHDGILWVGTHGGLNRFDPTTEQFTAYTVEDGLPNDAIASLLIDEQGQLWLGTMGGGLSRFTPQTGVFRNYDIGDGLQGAHFFIGAAHRGRSGEMFFGGLDGFNAFYPAQVRDNPYVPPIVLTAFRKFDQVVDLGVPLADVKEVTLSYRDNFFAFEFAALDYTDPARNRYAYQLEGFDREWIACGARRYASYTNLPPGQYTFRVKGSNNDGVWNEEGLSVAVRITPPFWQTGWFRGLAAAVVLGIGLSIYRVRARNIAALREREERFRTLFESAPLCVFEVDLAPTPPRILRANPQAARAYGWLAEEWASVSLEQIFPAGARPDLERMTERLRAGETVHLESTHCRRDGGEFPVRMSAAPERAPGRKLAIVVVEDITAEKAWRSEEEAIAEERRRIAREIHDGLAQDLVSLRMKARLWHQLVDEAPQQMHAEIDALRDLLSNNIREVRRAIFALRPVALDELGFYPALRQFVTELGEQNQLRIDLSVVGPPERLPSTLEPVLFRIIQEALNNVVRHARAGTAEVELRLDEPDVVCLCVRDDGVGFDPSTVEQAALRGHLGLKQMRERVARLRGTLTLHSAPGRGTEICVVLPVEENLRRKT